MTCENMDKLLDCWARPFPDCQPTLFQEEVEEVLAELRVTESDLRRWHRRGWISFEVDDMDKLDGPHCREIEFVRSVVSSGLGDELVSRLFEGLPKPYSFHPQYVAYNFLYGWVVPVRDDPFDVVDENVSDWIEQLGAENSLGRLEQLKSLIDDQIEASSNTEFGDESGDKEQEANDADKG